MGEVPLSSAPVERSATLRDVERWGGEGLYFIIFSQSQMNSRAPMAAVPI